MKNFALLAWSIIFLAACSAHRDSRPGATLDYADVFDSYTKTGTSMKEFEPVIEVNATYWSKKVREAYVEEMAEKFRYTPEREKALAQEQLQEDETFIVFVISVATREMKWNDLDKADSLWRVTLENSDGSLQVDPERIELISQKNERANYFYRRMSTFGRTYRVRFPKQNFLKESELHLHISGPRGSVALRYGAE